MKIQFFPVTGASVAEVINTNPGGTAEEVTVGRRETQGENRLRQETAFDES